MKTLEEIKQDPWFKSRPPAIQQAILSWPPNRLYRLRETGQHVSLYSFVEDKGGKCTTCTVIVQKGHNEGAVVFGIKLTSLRPLEDQ